MQELRLFFRGVPASPPAWALAIEAAGGDPLRAREIWEGIDEEWWTYYLTYRGEEARAANKRMEGG